MTALQPPVLTTEERKAALATAAKVRAERAKCLRAFEKEELSLSQVFEMRSGKVVGRIFTKDLLKRISGIGPLKAERLMMELGISQRRRLKGLGCRQVKALEEWYDEKKIRDDSLRP